MVEILLHLHGNPALLYVVCRMGVLVVQRRPAANSALVASAYSNPGSCGRIPGVQIQEPQACAQEPRHHLWCIVRLRIPRSRSQYFGLGHFIPNQLPRWRSSTCWIRHRRLLGRNHSGTICFDPFRSADWGEDVRRGAHYRSVLSPAAGVVGAECYWRCRGRFAAGSSTRSGVPLCTDDLQSFDAAACTDHGDWIHRRCRKLWRCSGAVHNRTSGAGGGYVGVASGVYWTLRSNASVLVELAEDQ